MQHNFKATVEAQLEAQRYTAQQAARPMVSDAELARDLAKSMLAALDDGRREDAKALALALRPLLGWLD